MNRPDQPPLPLTDPQHAAQWEPTQDPTDRGWWDGKGGEHTIETVTDPRGRL